MKKRKFLLPLVCVFLSFCFFLHLQPVNADELINSKTEKQRNQQPITIAPQIINPIRYPANITYRKDGNILLAQKVQVDTPVSEAVVGEVSYEVMVVAKRPSKLLAMYNTLTAPVDKEHLAQLGQECYQKVTGSSYERVMISWFLPGQPKSDKPWAITNYAKGLQVVEILDESLADKFPAVRRFNQPGHQMMQ